MKTALFSFLLLTSIACTKDNCEQPTACSLAPEAGPCEALIPGYYYDQESGSCKEFMWGGCGGTRPFETLEACQTGCGCED